MQWMQGRECNGLLVYQLNNSKCVCNLTNKSLIFINGSISPLRHSLAKSSKKDDSGGEQTEQKMSHIDASSPSTKQHLSDDPMRQKTPEITDGIEDDKSIKATNENIEESFVNSPEQEQKLEDRGEANDKKDERVSE